MKIKLQNGIVLDNLTLNGNNYISENLIDSSVFENNLGLIYIDEVEHKNIKLIQNVVYEGKSWFILSEKTEEELLKERLKSTEDAMLMLMDMIGGI